MSMVGKCYVEYDGKRIEFDTTNIEISYSPGEVEELGDFNYRSSMTTEVQVSGRVTKMEELPKHPHISGHWWGVDMAKGKDNMVWHHVVGTPHGDDYFRKHYNCKWDYNRNEVTKNEENNMSDCYADEKSCEGEGSYGGERLAQKIKELGLSDEQRKLRKYGLVNEVGLITNKGKEVLLNHLLNAYSEEIVEDLEVLEETQKSGKEE